MNNLETPHSDLESLEKTERIPEMEKGAPKSTFEKGDTINGKEQVPNTASKEIKEIPERGKGDVVKTYEKKTTPEQRKKVAIETITADPSNAEDVKFAEKLIQSIPVSEWLGESPETLKSVFLTKDNVVDFRGHDGAKWKIGAGDLLPRSSEYASIDGVIGKRSRTARGKVGYLTVEGKYLAIWGGEKLDPSPDVSADIKAGFEKVQTSSTEEETVAKKSFLEKTKTEEVVEGKAREELLSKLQKMGLQIDGLDPQDFKNLDKEKVKTFFTSMTPREVYEFRKTIDKGGKKYSTVNFRQLMKVTGLDQIEISGDEASQYITEALKKNGSVFPADQVQKLGFKTEADIFKKILEKESGFKPFAISGTGALGIAQMTSQNYVKKNFNPFDWKKSIEFQIDHLKTDFQRFGDIEKTIVAYNRGGGYVSKMSKMHGPNWHNAMARDKYGKEGYDYLNKVSQA